MTIANVLQRSLAGLCLLLLATFASATVTVENYGYPIKDRFVATVVGTPEGYEAKLETAEPIYGRLRFRGVLASVEGDEVLINIVAGAETMTVGQA